MPRVAIRIRALSNQQDTVACLTIVPSVHHQARAARSPVKGGSVKFAVSIDENDFLLEDNEPAATMTEAGSDNKTPLLVSECQVQPRRTVGLAGGESVAPDPSLLQTKLKLPASAATCLGHFAMLLCRFGGAQT